MMDGLLTNIKQFVSAHKSQIKAIVTLIFITILYFSLDFQSIFYVFQNFNFLIYLAVFGIMVSGVLYSSLKWKIIMSDFMFNLSYKSSLISYMGGISVNAITPGFIGGDLSRAVIAHRRLKLTNPTQETTKSDFLKTVVIDRFTGLIALYLIFLVSLLTVWIQGLEQYKLVVNLIILGNALFVFLIVIYYLVSNERKLLVKINEFKEKYLQGLETKKIGLYVVLALIFQFSTILATYIPLVLLVGSSEYDHLLLIMFICIVNFLAILPISVQGLGVREYFSFLLYPLVGVNPDYAVVVSLIIFVSAQLISIISTIIFTFFNFIE